MLDRRGCDGGGFCCPSRKSTFLLVAFFTLGAFQSIPVVASSDEVAEAAASAFKRGVEHYKRGEYEKAVVLFEQANEMRPSWKIWFNIGQCYALLKSYGMALEAFERYMADGGDEVTDERREVVLSEMSRLKAMVAEIAVEAPDGTQILVDGRKRGKVPVTPLVRITASIEHEVELRKGDEVLLTRKIKLGAGQSLTVSHTTSSKLFEDEEDASTGKQAADEAEITQQSSAEDDNKNVHKAVFWSGVGTTTALVGATLTSTLVAKGRFEDAEGTAKDSSERDSLDRAQAATIVLGASAIAAFAATTALAFFTDFDGERRVDVGLSVGPRSIGCRVAF